MPEEDTGVINYFLKTHLNWQIPQFSVLPRVAGSRIWSPKFGYLGETKKYVLAPVGIKFGIDPSNWLSLSLTSMAEEEDVIECIHVGVTDENRRIINICECMWNSSYRGFDRSRLVKIEGYSLRVDGEVPNGYLRLFCEFHPKYARESADAATQTENKTGVDKLLENLKDLYANKETCDVILIVKDKEYKAHRTILMARSSVFAATFKHNMLESRTNVINISDCDPDSFPKFLEYLYSGEFTEISVRDAINLYYTSDKYNIEELKTFCVEKLMQLMTVKTMCEIADFADKYDETQLFTVIQEFFNKNYLQIFLTAEWKDLLKNNHWLVNKLTTQMAKLHLKDSQTKDDDKIESTLNQDHISLTQGMAESSDIKRTATASGFSFGTPPFSESNANSFSTNLSMKAPPNFNFNSIPDGPFQFTSSGFVADKPSSSVNSGPRKIYRAVRRVTRRKE